MGQNKRYDMIGPELARHAAREARRPEPIGLTDNQVQASGHRRDAPEPIPVTAWVTHQVAYIEEVSVDADVIAWTGRACLLRWRPEGDRVRHVWVWADAVTRR